MNAPSQLPRWFLLLPVLAAIAWWPWAPYWKSDDFLMLHHANDLSRVLGDFTGPQYGATDIWFFYRPLMTASFWLELQLAGGPSPLLSHTTNVLVHAGSALLVALLWRRWLGDAKGFVAGLLWALMPGHQGAITWAVGRSDGHGTFWSLLALLLFLRHGERLLAAEPARRWPFLLATTAALATKEIAFVLPPAMTLLAFHGSRGTPFAARAALALRRTAPAWLLFGGYLAWRYAALGRLGGYASMQYDPLPMLLGFLHVVRDLLVPWLWSRPEGGVLPWLAAAPILAAVVWHLSCARRWRPFAAALAMFALACVPMAPFFVSHENPHLLRYYCLPCAALAGLLAAPWRALPLFVLAAWALPMVAVRTSVHDTDRWTRAQHTALLQVAATPVAEPLFVAGLPTNTAFAVAFHYGADRLLAPPFTPALHRIYPLRPVVPVAAPFRIDDGEASATGPLALPGGSVWWFRGTADEPGDLLRGAAVSPLPDLPITGDRDGTVDLSSTRLAAMEAAKVGDRLVTGIAPVAFYRVTIFTALGYFACIVPEHARAGDPHGVIDLLQFFAGERAIGVPADQARATFAVYAPGDAFVMRGLEVPTTHDLSPEFPVLVEACSVQGDQLVPTHRSHRLLRFQFDRGYAEWVRRALNL